MSALWRPGAWPRRMGARGGERMFLVTGATGKVGAELVRVPAESGGRGDRGGRYDRLETVRAALDGAYGGCS